MAKLVLCVLLMCGLLGWGSAQQALSRRRQAEQEILQRILRPDAYDKDVNPGGDDTGGRTNVTVNLYVRDILNIDEINHEMVIQLTLRQQWRDPRLAYTDRRIGPDKENSTYVTVTDVGRVWRPDLFISNDIDSKRHDFAVVNAFVRIYPDGSVLSSERLTVTARCPMILHDFPFDSQTCSLRMASYGSTERDVVFQWKKEDPVQVNRKLTLTRYVFTSFETDYCDSHTQTGTYSCITVRFGLSRLVNYYIMQVFIPATMMFIVAYLAFWLDPENIIARLLINLIALFVMAVQTSRFNEQLPKVSYSKAIDLFTGLTLTFIFLALLETVIVNYMRRKETGESGEDKTASEDPESEALKPESDGAGRAESTPKKGNKGLNAVKDRMKKVLPKSDRGSAQLDAIARLVFPLIFLFFLIVYFGVYCS